MGGIERTRDDRKGERRFSEGSFVEGMYQRDTEENRCRERRRKRTRDLTWYVETRAGRERAIVGLHSLKVKLPECTCKSNVPYG